MTETKNKKSDSSLTLKHKIGYGLGDAGGCMTFAIMGSTFAMYCTDALKINTELLAILLAVWNVWDFINDPLMGAFMDRAFSKKHNPKGKFRPWLLRSAPLICVSFIALWSVPSLFEGLSLICVLFGLKIIYEGAYTMFNIPMGSLLSAMADNDKDRATLSSARGFGSAVGNAIPVVLMPMLIDKFGQTNSMGYAVGAAICAAINMTVGVVIGAIWGFSKKVDAFMVPVYNIIGNIPYILFISVMIMLFAPSFWTMVLALTVTGWLAIAYFIRTQVIIIRDREYNLASKCLGTSTFKIAMKNILPFMTSVIVTQLATEIPSYISYEVFLSYIGMGISDMSLGRLIFESEGAMLTPGWGFEFWSPVVVASIITVVLYVVGQSLGDASDPRTHM